MIRQLPCQLRILGHKGTPKPGCSNRHCRWPVWRLCSQNWIFQVCSSSDCGCCEVPQSPKRMEMYGDTQHACMHDNHGGRPCGVLREGKRLRGREPDGWRRKRSSQAFTCASSDPSCTSSHAINIATRAHSTAQHSTAQHSTAWTSF